MPKDILAPQRKVALLGIANGLSPDEVAVAMVVTKGTVLTHLHCAKVALGTHSRATAIARAFKLGIFKPHQIVEDGECPGTETNPNYCRCPCTGCKYNCGAHRVPELDDDWQDGEPEVDALVDSLPNFWIGEYLPERHEVPGTVQSWGLALDHKIDERRICRTCGRGGTCPYLAFHDALVTSVAREVVNQYRLQRRTP